MSRGMSSSRSFAPLAAAALLILAHLRYGAIASATSAASGPFAAFVEAHGRVYEPGSAEYASREALFTGRAREAAAQNRRLGRLWTAGVNELWDRTDDELAVLNGWTGRGRPERPGKAMLNEVSRVARTLPRAASWVHLNASRQVRRQGHCGSCWAVASATVLELHSEIYGAPRSVSVQELVDCVPNPEECGGQGGCQGATVELAMAYVMDRGLESVAGERDLPYTAAAGHCRAAQLSTVHSAVSLVQSAFTRRNGLSVKMRSWERLPENRYLPLLRAVVENGPVGVSVAATGWHMYSHGIYDSCSADAVVNHAVTLVGYGEVSANKKFYLIQNSWGSAWGEEGRIRLLRRDTDDTECGTDHEPEKGTACKGGPAQVTVCGMCGILYDSVVPHFSGHGIAAMGMDAESEM